MSSHEFAAVRGDGGSVLVVVIDGVGAEPVVGREPSPSILLVDATRRDATAAGPLQR